jgi:hypothetical protein
MGKMFKMIADTQNSGMTDPGNQFRCLFRHHGTVHMRINGMNVQILGNLEPFCLHLDAFAFG